MTLKQFAVSSGSGALLALVAVFVFNLARPAQRGIHVGDGSRKAGFSAGPAEERIAFVEDATSSLAVTVKALQARIEGDANGPGQTGYTKTENPAPGDPLSSPEPTRPHGRLWSTDEIIEELRLRRRQPRRFSTEEVLEKIRQARQKHSEKLSTEDVLDRLHGVESPGDDALGSSPGR